MGRITVPVDGAGWSRSAMALAVGVAAQGDLTVELAAVAGGRPAELEDRLATMCDNAVAAGAPRSTWIVLADGTIDAYARWSGSELMAAGRTARHSQRSDVSAARPATVPMLLGGPRLRTAPDRFRRMVVGVDGSPEGAAIVTSAESVARSIGVTIALIEILAPCRMPYDVVETAFVRHVASALADPPADFDTVCDPHPADAILRYVGRADDTIIALGRPQCRSGHRLSGRGVVDRVVHRATGPVLLIDTGAAGLGRGLRHPTWWWLS